MAQPKLSHYLLTNEGNSNKLTIVKSRADMSYYYFFSTHPGTLVL